MKKLDFGCGSGGYPGGDGVHPRDRGSWLEKYGDVDTLALDIDAGAINRAKNRICNQTTFVIGEGRQLPFADNSFDLVHEWGTLHHIAGYETAISEIARVLKCGGTLLACETIDDDPLYSTCRTLTGNWKGYKIESRFKSKEFLVQVEKYFHIDEVDYWYRPLIVDIPSYLFESYPGWVIGLYWQFIGSRIGRKIGLLPLFARHVTIKATKK